MHTKRQIRRKIFVKSAKMQVLDSKKRLFNIRFFFFCGSIMPISIKTYKALSLNKG